MPLPSAIKDDLVDLVKLASSVTEAHTIAVFLPTLLTSPRLLPDSSIIGGLSKLNAKDAIPLKNIIEPGYDTKNASIELVAVHSYSKITKDARIQAGAGLLGWVAEQGRPIYLSQSDIPKLPALYIEPETVQSLAVLPIDCTEVDPSRELKLYGVLMCDSLRSDAFSNSDIKLLEQISRQCQRLIYWASNATTTAHIESSWDAFRQKVSHLGDAIGQDSIDLLKLRIESFQELADRRGLSEAVKYSEQFFRLVQQALPPHFPIVRIPSGEIVIAVDNMMSTFFQQKLHNLALHLSTKERPLTVEVEHYGAKTDQTGMCNIDTTLQQKPKFKKLSSSGGNRA
jgi:hypothetical protein